VNRRAPKPAVEPSPLAGLLANRRWVQQRVPFPYVAATDVLAGGRLSRDRGGLSRGARAAACPRTAGRRSAVAPRIPRLRCLQPVAGPRHPRGPLALFMGRPLASNMLAALCGVRPQRRPCRWRCITTAVGSASGWVHNEPQHPAWFGELPAAGRHQPARRRAVRLPERPRACRPGRRPRRTVAGTGHDLLPGQPALETGRRRRDRPLFQPLARRPMPPSIGRRRSTTA